VSVSIAGKADWLGEKVAQMFAFLGSDDAREALRLRGHGEGGASGSWGAIAPHTAAGAPASQANFFEDHQTRVGASPFVAAKSVQVNVNVQNKIDRHGLATMVTEEQARAAARPQTGINGFDGSMQLVPAGGTGGW